MGRAKVIVSGNEITDLVRRAAVEGDGRTPPDSSFGIWEATTNKLINGGFESNLTGWQTGGTNSIVRASSGAKFGGTLCQVTYQDSATNLLERSPNVVHTVAEWIASAWVYIPAAWDGGDIEITITGLVSVVTNKTVRSDNSLRDQWQRIWTSYTPDGGDLSGAAFRIRVSGATPTAGRTINVDGCQTELNNIPTPYVETDGAEATRNNSRVQVPVAVVDEQQAWVALRVRMNWDSDDHPVNFLRMFDWRNDTDHYLVMIYNHVADKWNMERKNGGGAIASLSATQVFSDGDVLTIIGRWEANKVGISVGGSVFNDNAGGEIPTLTVETFDLMQRAGSAEFFDGDVLWFACGTGKLTDAMAAVINSLSDSDPVFGDFAANAEATMIWSANTVDYLTPSLQEPGRTVLKVRSPQQPHAEAISLYLNDLKYGFKLMRANSASFSINKTDRLFVEADGSSSGLSDKLFVGVAITIERADGLYPWAGFITKRTASDESPVVLFEAKDHAGVLFERAHSRANWGARSLSAAHHIQTIFNDADRRGVPPLMLDLDLTDGGPAISYEPRALSLLDVLRDMAENSGWEWELRSLPTPKDMNTKLFWVSRIGRDLRNELVLEQYRHFNKAKYVQSLSGFFGEVEAIGGTGPVSERPRASATPTRQSSLANKAPALGGSLVRFEPNVTNTEALTQTANAVLDSPDWVAEALSFSVVESELAPDSPLHVGDLITVRFSNLDLGLGLIRAVRILGLQLTAGSGIIDVTCKVVS